MLFRNLGSDSSPQQTSWTDLKDGAPTITGLANLCGAALLNPQDQLDWGQISDEAKAILVVAADRGTIDIRANRDSFDSADRFLAVCVEYDLDQRLLFLNKENPKQTIRFLEGFRELCEHGLVVHHLQKDFSLSTKGFEAAEKLNRADFESLIQFGVQLDH